MWSVKLGISVPWTQTCTCDFSKALHSSVSVVSEEQDETDEQEQDLSFVTADPEGEEVSECVPSLYHVMSLTHRVWFQSWC